MGIVLSIVVLGILIFVHELGHFLIAKFNRVGVLEFAIGFGPKLCRWTFGETTYTLRAIPLGGFVRMTGDDPRLVMADSDTPIGDEVAGASPIEGTTTLTPVQQEMVKDRSRWFLKQGYLARCAIVLAGPMFNFLFAWVLASGDILVNGKPVIDPATLNGPVTIGSIIEGFPADIAGLKVGDRIVRVDGKAITAFPQLIDVVQGSNGKELSFEIERPATDPKDAPVTEVIEIQPTSDTKEIDIATGRNTDGKTYQIGIVREFKALRYEPVTVLEAIEGGGMHVASLSMMTLRVVKALVTGNMSPRKALGGPISIIDVTKKSASQGWAALIGIMVFLNVTLGVMNLLPIPVLDGGHLTLFTIEKLKGSPLSHGFTERATQVGMGVLLLLMVFAIGNDLVRFLL